jgi:hypothetical protein
VQGRGGLFIVQQREQGRDVVQALSFLVLANDALVRLGVADRRRRGFADNRQAPSQYQIRHLQPHFALPRCRRGEHLVAMRDRPRGAGAEKRLASQNQNWFLFAKNGDCHFDKLTQQCRQLGTTIVSKMINPAGNHRRRRDKSLVAGVSALRILGVANLVHERRLELRIGGIVHHRLPILPMVVGSHGQQPKGNGTNKKA